MMNIGVFSLVLIVTVAPASVPFLPYMLAVGIF
jgi:hypothetical protein